MSASQLDVAVVGAGALGLFTAYSLARRGANVVIYEAEPFENLRNASWGNAGHIIPIMSVPIASPANIKAAATGIFKKGSFIRVPTQIDSHTAGFMLEFFKTSRRSKWLTGLAALHDLNARALAEFEEIQASGVDCGFERAPFVSAFETVDAARGQMADHVDATAAGASLSMDLLSKSRLHELEPLSRSVGQFGLMMNEQGLVQPPLMLDSLMGTLGSLGVRLVQDAVTEILPTSSGDVKLEFARLPSAIHQKVVVATGAWLDQLSSDHGVQPKVLAGFGYSLQVDVPSLPQGMLYFPEAKIATTRLGDSLRISTLLQIDKPGAAFDQKSGQLLENNARRVLPMAQWETVRNKWHGGRPISSDGIPIIGETRTANVYVNGGHGMWGVTLGPISGRLLAEAMLAEDPEISVPGFSARRSA